MVQPVHLITEPAAPPRAQLRTVAPDALAAAFQSLFPASSSRMDPRSFADWLREYEKRPEECIGGGQRMLTAALFKALNLPKPNTEEMALFLLTTPGLEAQARHLVYVSAKNLAGENADLIVRAVSREHAEREWRDHFDGWDLPDRPGSIVIIRAEGPTGAIPWNALTRDVDNDFEGLLEHHSLSQDRKAQANELFYVSAKTPDSGDNVDLIVRAASREHAETAWRGYFDGWDLPARPDAITSIPTAGALGAIPWDFFTGDAEEHAQAEIESQIPSL